MLRSFINSFTKPQSLTLQLRAFHSKPKSHSKKIKYYEAHPNLFQKYSRMKPPDLTKKDITFPINIPIKFRYRFKPTKRLEIPAHDFLNFKFMTGNEILLYLERVSELKPSEICGALIELGKRPGAESIFYL